MTKEIPSFVYDPSCVLYLPLWKRDGATFVSDDAMGHACTVTGATWGTQGRTFDITDDRIQIGDTSDTALQFLTDTTIAVWAKLNTKTAESQSMLSKSNVVAEDRFNICFGTTSGFRIFMENSNVVNISADNVGTANLGQFYFVTFRFGSGGQKFDVDLVSLATHANTGVLNTGTNTPLRIGQDLNNDFELGGTVGELIIFNRYLLDIELANIRDKTKWRYQ